MSFHFYHFQQRRYHYVLLFIVSPSSPLGPLANDDEVLGWCTTPLPVNP
jgi:hypothetical protein